MNAEIKFIILWAVVLIPFFAGSKIRESLESPQGTAKKLIRINLFLLEPFILFWSIWGLHLNSHVIFLPVAGISTVIVGYFTGKVAVRLLKLKSKTASSYLISSILANQGLTLGGLICYLIAGEQGLGLATIYVIYFLPFVFLFIFPYARIASMQTEAGSEKPPVMTLKDYALLFFNFQNLPVAGILVALVMQLFQIPRPVLFFNLDYLIYTAISLYYLTLGINFQSGHITTGFKEQAALAMSKFIILPAVTFTALYFVELDPVVETVILVQSCMPAAVYSVISSILFDLDAKLTSGLFVVNSLLFLGIVLPVLMMIRGMI